MGTETTREPQSSYHLFITNKFRQGVPTEQGPYKSDLTSSMVADLQYSSVDSLKGSLVQGANLGLVDGKMSME